MATSKTIGSGEIHAAIERLAAAISSRHQGEKSLLLLGIANGGVELARRLTLSLSKGSWRGRKPLLFRRQDLDSGVPLEVVGVKCE